MTIRRLSVPVVLLAGTLGCNEITAAGPPPAFVQLGSASAAATSPMMRNFPADSCPSLGAADPAWPRRALGVPGATIALTPEVIRSAVPFGDGRGFAARDGISIIAVTYDDDLATLSGLRDGRDPQSPAPVGDAPLYPARCRVTVDGREATLLVGFPFAITVNGERRVVSRPPMALLATGPGGRSVNVFLERFFDGDRASFEAGIARLLAMAGSIRW